MMLWSFFVLLSTVQSLHHQLLECALISCQLSLQAATIDQHRKGLANLWQSVHAAATWNKLYLQILCMQEHDITCSSHHTKLLASVMYATRYG
jgi:hypothetical protein